MSAAAAAATGAAAADAPRPADDHHSRSGAVENVRPVIQTAAADNAPASATMYPTAPPDERHDLPQSARGQPLRNGSEAAATSDEKPFAAATANKRSTSEAKKATVAAPAMKTTAQSPKRPLFNFRMFRPSSDPQLSSSFSGAGDDAANDADHASLSPLPPRKFQTVFSRFLIAIPCHSLHFSIFPFWSSFFCIFHFSVLTCSGSTIHCSHRFAFKSPFYYNCYIAHLFRATSNFGPSGTRRPQFLFDFIQQQSLEGTFREKIRPSKPGAIASSEILTICEQRLRTVDPEFAGAQPP